MISYMMSCVISCHEQDCVIVLAPPKNPNPVESFNFKTNFDSTLLQVQVTVQLHLVSDRPRGDYAQWIAQGGVPGLFQHV